MRFRLWFWFKGVDLRPWWYRDFNSHEARKRFLDSTRPHLKAYAKTNSENIRYENRKMVPPKEATIFHTNGEKQ